MNEELKREGTIPSQRPRSPRVPVDFAVALEGQTPTGEPFHAEAIAVRVSRGGATLATDAAVNLGDSVRLTPPYGRTINAEVNGIWTDAGDGKQRIGVKLLDDNGWFAE
ncbi:MAG TPA: PilZ domain-containing protein [Pyrinomonadaceae bacterium]|nr:PilZ domain-containing protein [Pyrinomonadaceae bacterium]